MASAQRLVENVRRLDSGGEPQWIRNWSARRGDAGAVDERAGRAFAAARG
jgi:hypothetical protein